MDDLPCELVSRILNELPLKDKLRAREVSKKFLFLIDAQSQKSLVVAKNKLYVDFHWFDDYQMVDFRNLLLYHQRSQLLQTNLFESRFFGNLKKLQFHCDYSAQLTGLHFLESLTELETLKISILCPHYSDETFELKLPKLKSANVTVDKRIKLSFLSPKLKYLVTNRSLNLTSTRIERVRHLQTVKETSSNYCDLKRFTGLHRLELILNREESISLLNEQIDGGLPELRELCIKNRSVEALNLSRLKVCRSIRVYVNGILIRHWDQLKPFREQYLLEADKLQVYLDNYPAIHRQLPVITTVNYCDCWEFSSDRIPDDFLGRLVNLVRVIVNGRVASKSDLIRFLSRCERIKKLELIDSHLDQQFYSNLHHCLPVINHLVIQDRLDRFDFLFALKHLGTLKTNHPLDFSLVRDLFMSLSDFIQIEFLGSDGEFLIIKPAYKTIFFTEKQDDEQLKRLVDDLSDAYSQKIGCSFQFMAGNYINDGR